jgi:hypothetical protein
MCLGIKQLDPVKIIFPLLHLHEGEEGIDGEARDSREEVVGGCEEGLP